MTSDGRELMRDQEKGMLASSLSFPMQSFFLEFRLLLFFVFFYYYYFCNTESLTLARTHTLTCMSVQFLPR